MCPTCAIPMKTEDGSENGKWGGATYMTEEIKVCPDCGLRVRERYEATKLIKEVSIK